MVLANYFPWDRRGLVIFGSYRFTQLIKYLVLLYALNKISNKYLYIFTFQKIFVRIRNCDVSDAEDENEEVLTVKSCN